MSERREEIVERAGVTYRYRYVGDRLWQIHVLFGGRWVEPIELLKLAVIEGRA